MSTKDYYTRIGEEYVLDIKQTLIANVWNLTITFSSIVGIISFVKYIQTLPMESQPLLLVVLLLVGLPYLVKCIDFQPIYKKRGAQ